MKLFRPMSLVPDLVIQRPPPFGYRVHLSKLKASPRENGARAEAGETLSGTGQGRGRDCPSAKSNPETRMACWRATDDDPQGDAEGARRWQAQNPQAVLMPNTPDANLSRQA